MCAIVSEWSAKPVAKVLIVRIAHENDDNAVNFSAANAAYVVPVGNAILLLMRMVHN